MKQPRRSALIDLVMKDASEEEKAEATLHWFGFLRTLMKIAREEELHQMVDSRESGVDDRFAA
jgi:uncharacterized protein YbgA (DUF1722 family)